jgi:hypothetical protein
VRLAFRKSELRRGHVPTAPTGPPKLGFGSTAERGPAVAGPPGIGALKRGDTSRNLLARQGTGSNLLALEKVQEQTWELDFNEFKRFVAFSEQGICGVRVRVCLYVTLTFALPTDEKKDHIRVAVRMRPFSGPSNFFSPSPSRNLFT